MRELRSRDPYDDYLEEEARQYEREKKMPRCDECGRLITSEIFYEIDGTRYCPDCLEEYRRHTDDYITEE